MKLAISTVQSGQGSSQHEEIPDGKWVVLTMVDTGTGMPSELLEHALEPFFTTKDIGKGTGLGLSQVYGIVKQHKGHLKLESTEGRGTSVHLYFPFLDSTEKISPSEKDANLAFGNGETVLLVDDQPEVRAVIRDMLEYLNYNVKIAENGKAALQVYLENKGQVSIVITDLVMPEMSGQELCRALSNLEGAAPVIAMSGHPLEKDISQLKSIGVADVFLKPPKIEEIARTLSQILANN